MVDELLHLEKEYRDNMLHPREIKQRKMMKLVYVILLNVISTAREHLKTSKKRSIYLLRRLIKIMQMCFISLVEYMKRALELKKTKNSELWLLEALKH